MKGKRILSGIMSVILAFTMVFANYTPVHADDPAQDPKTVTTTTQDGVVVTKTATITENGQAKIDFVVDGAKATVSTQTIGKTDIIFLLDVSSSMRSTVGRLESAKGAGVSFAKALLTEDNKDSVRIGVIKFSKTASTICSLTNKVADVEKAINNASTATGTNIQAAIKAAEDMFEKNSDKNAAKIILVLSDGEPIYSYKAKTVSSTDTKLNDGSSTKLITEFDYNVTNSNSSSVQVSNGKEVGWHDAAGKLYDEERVESIKNNTGKYIGGKVEIGTSNATSKEVTWAYRKVNGE